MKKIIKKFIIILIFIFTFSESAFSEKINVAFAIDNNYWLYTLLTINSILKNNTSNSDYYFYVIESDLSNKNRIKMEKYVKKHHQNIKFIDIDLSVIDSGHDYYKDSSNLKHISRISMARIFLPDLLPDLNKVLYLDSDILVTADLSELYNMNVKNYAALMTKNIDIPCYNAGVMLVNLDYWRKNNITQKMVNYIKKKKSLQYMDQDLINIILMKKIKTINPRWNNQYGYMSNHNNIVHYIGGYKPWLINVRLMQNTTEYFEKRPYIKLYNDYWRNSDLFAYKFPVRTKQLFKIYLDYCNIMSEKLYNNVY